MQEEMLMGKGEGTAVDWQSVCVCVCVCVRVCACARTPARVPALTCVQLFLAHGL